MRNLVRSFEGSNLVNTRLLVLFSRSENHASRCAVRKKPARVIDDATLGSSALSAAMNYDARGDNRTRSRLQWTGEIHIEARCRITLAFIKCRMDGTGHRRT